ncbi:unnamed protein product [Toxocara canis]|uniref:MADF domain-containing protein n=1 Tax=Toxocara canis TaxID=6265 RepID=A0A183U9Y7_TOXCA|nr:unnamed protein product [Toxocara canis]
MAIIKDPAPACSETDVAVLGATLVDLKKSLWERYRAMFALRNINTDESVKALTQGCLHFLMPTFSVSMHCARITD